MNTRSESRLELVVGALCLILSACFFSWGDEGRVGRWGLLFLGAFEISRGVYLLRRPNANVNPHG